MEKNNISLADAKILYELGQITQEEYVTIVQIKTNQAKEMVDAYNRENARPEIQLS